jgi:hypothetical protein
MPKVLTTSQHKTGTSTHTIHLWNAARKDLQAQALTSRADALASDLLCASWLCRL